MQPIKPILFLLLLLALACNRNNRPTEASAQNISPMTSTHNTLTETERREGWRLLFDGKTTDGWHIYGNQPVGPAWKVVDGTLMLDAQEEANGKVVGGGDLVTDDEFEAFELYLEWKISPCGNSGILHSVVESDQYGEPYHTGPEMQVLDNSCHPDGKVQSHRAGDLYDLISANPVTVRPAGEWNEVRILKYPDGRLEHWLNGVKVVETQMYTDEWNSRIARSKFKQWPGFGQARKGRINLQDHNDTVWYRNMKIREME